MSQYLKLVNYVSIVLEIVPSCSQYSLALKFEGFCPLFLSTISQTSSYSWIVPLYSLSNLALTFENFCGRSFNYLDLATNSQKSLFLRISKGSTLVYLLTITIWIPSLCVNYLDLATNSEKAQKSSIWWLHVVNTLCLVYTVTPQILKRLKSPLSGDST
jgi:hypothetical protein